MDFQQKVLEHARQLANENGEDTEGWGTDEFVCYLLEAADWQSVMRVSWAQGSFAGIEQWRGLYYAFDDAETYGPYASFKEARTALQVDAGGYDKIIERWVSPEYADADHD